MAGSSKGKPPRHLKGKRSVRCDSEYQIYSKIISEKEITTTTIMLIAEFQTILMII